MNKTYGIILTIITGLFFLIGGLISFKTKDKEKLNRFSVSLAFVIMNNLIICDLLPEIIESLEKYIRLASYYKFNYVVLEPWGTFPFIANVISSALPVFCSYDEPSRHR